MGWTYVKFNFIQRCWIFVSLRKWNALHKVENFLHTGIRNSQVEGREFPFDAHPVKRTVSYSCWTRGGEGERVGRREVCTHLGILLSGTMHFSRSRLISRGCRICIGLDPTFRAACQSSPEKWNTVSLPLELRKYYAQIAKCKPASSPGLTNISWTDFCRIMNLSKAFCRSSSKDS